MKKICVLGSTGSIGTQALDIIRNSPQEFCAFCLCTGSNAKALALYANEFLPQYVGLCDENAADELNQLLQYKPNIIIGKDCAQICAALSEVDIVVNGISGMSGFLPFISAIKAGKTIAAANKESIVCAHGILGTFSENGNSSLVAPFPNGARIIPVDSEQSAIFQCLESSENVQSLILTASGGAFRNKSASELKNVTANDALAHPTWNMGKKITIDSATLFNKGLEITEAAFLFGFNADQIEVLIHPQSIVHSLVRFCDGSIKAQLSLPDMRIAIQYAFTYPKRKISPLNYLDLTVKPLEFFNVDTNKYPSVTLAYAALKEGKVLPTVYNAANEIAVDAFVKNECAFTDIAKIVAYAMKKADTHVNYTCVCDIMDIDAQARQYALEACNTIKRRRL